MSRNTQRRLDRDWFPPKPLTVLLPLAAGLVLAALTVWVYQVQQNRDTDFARHAVITQARVIDVYNGRPYPNQLGGPDTYSRFAHVRFTASGRAEVASVLVDADCSGACLPGYQPGDSVQVAYDQRHPAPARITGQHGRYRGPGTHLTWDIYTLGLGTLFAFGFVLLVLILGGEPPPRPRRPAPPA